jgi:hypothetical protein
MRDSVEAWMEMDRQDLKAAVASQLSVDEDEDVLASADFDADEVLQSARVKPAGSAKNLPPGDLEWQAGSELGEQLDHGGVPDAAADGGVVHAAGARAATVRGQQLGRRL